jgi:hypothetical protein
LPTLQELEYMMKKWLEEEQWTYSKEETTDFALCYKVDLDEDHKLTVAYIQDSKMFIIAKKVVPTEEENLSYKLSLKKYGFILQIEKDLLPMTIRLNYEPSIEKLHTIRVYKIINLSEFNRTEFVDSMHDMEYAIDVVRAAWINLEKASNVQE